MQTVLPNLSALHDSPDFSKLLASKYIRLHISLEDADHANLLLHLDGASSFITQALCGGSRVLVHCAAGISRSTTASFYLHSCTPPTCELCNMVTGHPHRSMQLPSCLPSSVIHWSCELYNACNVLLQAYSLVANTKMSHCIPLAASVLLLCTATLCRHTILLPFVTCDNFAWIQAAFPLFWAGGCSISDGYRADDSSRSNEGSAAEGPLGVPQPRLHASAGSVC